MLTNNKVLLLGYRGAPQTIDVMRRAALESQGNLIIRQFCEEVCRELDSKDYLSEILAIYHAVLQRCRYMRDPKTVELVRAPYVVAEALRAGQIPQLDCDDMAVFIAACMMSMGGHCRFVTAAFNDQFVEGRRQYSHVWTDVFEPRSQQWIITDPVAADRTRKMAMDVRHIKYWEI